MNSFSPEEHPHLYRNLKSLAVIGMWPIETKSQMLNTLHRYYGNFVYGYFSIFLISEYVELYYVRGDLQELTTNASVSLLYTVGFAKIYTLFRNKSKLRSLVLQVSNDEKNVLKYSDQATKDILNGYTKRGKEATNFFWTLTFFTILGFFIIPKVEYSIAESIPVLLANGSVVFKKDRPLIFSSYFPFDKDETPFYEVAFGIQTIAGTIGASFLAIWDTFIVALIVYAIGQLQILQYSIRTVSARRDCEIPDEKEIYDKLVKCVQHHVKIMSFIEDLDTIISPVMFLYFGVCSIMLCAIGFQATSYGASLRVGFMVEYLIAMLVQLLLFYWHGNEVILESSEVLAALWDSGWYERPRPFRSTVNIMMIRSSRRLRFTIGRFYTMSLQTFILIVKTSYSYFALLRQVYNRT